MSLVQCKLGYAEPIIFGRTYTFNRDRFDRFVCRVDEEKHRDVLLAVEHYVVVPDTPEDAAPAKARKKADVAAPRSEPGLGTAVVPPVPVADAAPTVATSTDTPAPAPQPAPAQPVKDPVMTDIKGIGPSTASKLAEAGFTEVKQIAALTEEDATALDGLLKLKGAIARDGWIAKAKALIGE
jgi:predicted flap endonuclease-1-like 5' DNA nuclease